jgi:hypothetical protein
MGARADEPMESALGQKRNRHSGKERRSASGPDAIRGRSALEDWKGVAGERLRWGPARGQITCVTEAIAPGSETVPLRPGPMYLRELRPA